MEKKVIDVRYCEEQQLSSEIDKLHELGYGAELKVGFRYSPFGAIAFEYEISVIKFEEEEEDDQ